MVAALQCHDDINVCRICIGWLRRERAGSTCRRHYRWPTWRSRSTSTRRPGSASKSTTTVSPSSGLNDQHVFDVDLKPALSPETNGAGCYIVLDDVDGWHDRLVSAGLPVTAVEDMPWGMHEFTLTDPSGNHIRIGQKHWLPVLSGGPSARLYRPGVFTLSLQSRGARDTSGYRRRSGHVFDTCGT